MRYKLTPAISYLIGFWKKLRNDKGISINGTPEQINVFVEQIINLKLIEPNKIIISNDNSFAYFYHTKLKNFFLEIIEQELDKFKYKNDYSGNYLAGIIDAVGNIYSTEKINLRTPKNTKINFEKIENEKQKLYYLLITHATPSEEQLLIRLGFRAKLANNKIAITKINDFVNFIRPYVKIVKLPNL